MGPAGLAEAAVLVDPAAWDGTCGPHMAFPVLQGLMAAAVNGVRTVRVAPAEPAGRTDLQAGTTCTSLAGRSP